MGTSVHAYTSVPCVATRVHTCLCLVAVHACGPVCARVYAYIVRVHTWVRVRVHSHAYIHKSTCVLTPVC